MPNAAHGFKRARPGRRCSGQEYRWIARAAQALPAAEAAEAMAAQSAVLCRACEKGYCKQRGLRSSGMGNTAALCCVYKTVPWIVMLLAGMFLRKTILGFVLQPIIKRKCNGGASI